MGSRSRPPTRLNDQTTSFPTAAGVVFAATGLAHLVVPQAFFAITAPAFPRDTTTWTKWNGVTEAVAGTAIAIPATRKAGLVALGAYVAFLGSRIVLAKR